MATTQRKSTDVLADFKVAPARKVAHKIDSGAKRASVPAVGDGAYIARGTRSRDDLPCLVLRHGAQDSSIPLVAVAAAISQGVISAEEIAALLK